MDIGKTVYFTDRKEWRQWLAENYDREKEIWMVYPKKGSGKPRILYNDAVEEALCFGWIDSTAKRIDEGSYARRFSPRHSKTPYSETNKQRMRKLLKEGLVIPSVAASLKGIINEDFTEPADILQAIKSDVAAWENYQGFSVDYKRIRIGYIKGARDRPQEFKKRLDHFVEMTKKNKQFGFSGIEKHY